MKIQFSTPSRHKSVRRVCTSLHRKGEMGASLAYPQLRACRGAPLPEGPSEWVGWPFFLSDVSYLYPPARALCPSQWDTFPILCVDLASLSSSRAPVLVLSPGQDQALFVA